MRIFHIALVALASLFLPSPLLHAADQPAPKKRPVILIRSGWQTVNIGDIAHSHGMLSLLETYAPDAQLIIWGVRLEDGVEENLKGYFPRVRFVHGDPLQPNTPIEWKSLSPEVQQAFHEADIFIHSSAPAVHMTPDFEAWRKLTGKPYGYYGITMDYKSPFAQMTERKAMTPGVKSLLDSAAFVLFRDSQSLADAREMGIHSPVMEFCPDAVFGIKQYDTARAEKWLRENGLRDKQFLCVIARTRFAPYHEIHNRPPTPNEEKRAAYSAKYVESDLAKIRDAITRWVRQTKLKVALVPEMTFEVALHKKQILDRLPEDVKPYVVWKNSYWMPDEAAAVYSKAIALLTMECHSPIIANAVGTPIVYVTAPTETYKKYMWKDIGLGKWMFEIDETSGKELADTLIQIQHDPAAASARLKTAMDFVSKRQKETMAIVLRSLPAPSSSK